MDEFDEKQLYRIKPLNIKEYMDSIDTEHIKDYMDSIDTEHTEQRTHELDIDLLEECHKAATPEPWDNDEFSESMFGPENSRLIVEVRNALPALIAAVRERDNLRRGK